MLAGCSESLVEVAAFVVTELTANVVKHARTPMRVGVDVDDGRVRIEVADSSSELPVARSPGGATSGRGLVIVERLADAWGVDASARGKTVWAELDRVAGYADRSSDRRKNSPRPATSRTRRV